MLTRVLALDLGTNTGWALQASHNWVLCGSQSFKPRRFDGGGMRYLRFNHWLSELCDGGKQPVPQEIVYEEVRRHRGTDAAHVYGGFLSVLQSFCEEREIPYSGVPVKTIKKHATGNGNANKKQMVEAVRALGYHPADDDEADAIALLLYHRSTSKET